jgi:hypothetical protein
MEQQPMRRDDEIEDALVNLAAQLDAEGATPSPFFMDGRRYEKNADGKWEWEPATEDNCS